MTYDITAIENELKKLVGFSNESNYSLSTSLTTATIKLNSYHPLLNLSILDNVKPENVNLDNFLINVRRSSITSLLNDLITKKLTEKGIKSKLSDTIIFDSTARFTNLVPNANKFVGWSLRPLRSINVKTVISKIAFQSLESVTNLPIYLFHSSQLDPIDVRLITTTKAVSVNWVTLEDPLTLSYTDQDKGGYYFIGYYQDDLIESSSPNNKAIYKEHNLSIAPCGSCNRFNTTYYNSWSKFLRIDTGTFLPTVNQEMVSNEKINFGENKNYGLNFEIKTNCDITSFLVENSSIFLPTLQVKYAIELLRYVDFSPLRKNTVTDTMKNEAFTAIHGSVSENNYTKVRGLSQDYADYLKGLNIDTSMLDPICLAGTRAGVKWNSAGQYQY